MAPVLKVLPSQRFGYGVVVDPEVRVRSGSDKRMVRCARMVCRAPRPGGEVCGTVYLAMIAKLYRGERKSCGCMRRGRARQPGGLVQKNRSGYAVWLYVGWFKSREQAADIAARCGLVIKPKVPPITGV